MEALTIVLMVVKATVYKMAATQMISNMLLGISVLPMKSSWQQFCTKVTVFPLVEPY